MYNRAQMHTPPIGIQLLDEEFDMFEISAGEPALEEESWEDDIGFVK